MRLGAAAAITCVVLFLHVLLPFRFPIPWPDETSFIAPAFELARHGTLFVWGMNPDRLVMWMPPGYFFFLAALFKMFGYSFALVRWASAACIIASAWLIGGLVARFAAGRRAVLLHALTVLAFASPYVLMSANIGRMEALLAVLMLASLVACTRGLPVLGGAIVAACATIHFSAVFFVLPYAALFAWLLVSRQNLVVRPGELAGLAVAALVLGAYAWLIERNLAGFVEDIGYQFRLKRFYGHNDPYHPFWPFLVACGLAGLVLARRRCVDGPGFLALYGAGFVLMATEGREIWYDLAPPLGFLLVAIGLVASAGPQMRRHVSLASLTLCVASLLATGFRPTPFLNPLLPTHAMLARDLLPAPDVQRMRDTIAALPAGSTVEFAWAGTQPFFLDALDRAHMRWGVPQHSATDSRLDRRMDFRMQCDSPDTPDLLWIYYPRHMHAGRDAGCDIAKQ